MNKNLESLPHFTRRFIVQSYRDAIARLSDFEEDYMFHQEEYLNLVEVGKEIGIKFWDCIPWGRKGEVERVALPIWRYKETLDYINAEADSRGLFRDGCDYVVADILSRSSCVAIISQKASHTLRDNNLVRIPVLSPKDDEYWGSRNSTDAKTHGWSGGTDHSYISIHKRVIADLVKSRH